MQKDTGLRPVGYGSETGFVMSNAQASWHGDLLAWSAYFEMFLAAGN